MSSFEWTDEEDTRAVLRDGRLSVFGKPSMRRDDGVVAIGVDLPPGLRVETPRQEDDSCVDQFLRMTDDRAEGLV